MSDNVKKSKKNMKQSQNDKSHENKFEYVDDVNVVSENNDESNIEEVDKKDLPYVKEYIDGLKSRVEEKRIYIDYKTRLIVHSLLFIILFIITLIFIQNTFDLSSSKIINYNEKSNLDYKVYLKENNFYDVDYLGKDKIYVASLIDKILIDFRYDFNIEKETKVDFTYDIVAKLTINDDVTGSNYFEKEYELLSDKKVSIEDTKNFNLYEQVDINYAYYNSLANSFKHQYGIDTSNNLTVYLRINKDSETLDTSTMFVKIPLSEKSVNIELNYQDINNSSYIVETKESVIDNIIFGILSILLLVFTIVILLKLIRLINLLNGKKSIYDKYVNRILNEYDRLIVENSTGPALNKNNIIKISKFEELLDVRDNLKLPIMYYVVSEHNKCYFYIKHNHDLYLMIIKAIDLEKNEKN